MKLMPNRLWESNATEPLPHVIANVFKDRQFLHVRFQVCEPRECYSAEMEKDGGKAWEESCVEIFVESQESPGEYINFEFTSRGFCFAAKGRDRHHRREFLPGQYARILRFPKAPEFSGNVVSWELTVWIPLNLFGVKHPATGEIRGNLYKCGDKTRRPHYLSAFPIRTEKPDFHQTRFFQKIL